MSTKIFNGYEIVGHTLESFLPVLRELQAPLRAAAHQLSVQWVTRMAVAAHDRFTLDMAEPDSRSFLSNAEFDLIRQQDNVRKTQHRDPFVDFEFTVCLFPVEGRLLATTYCENRSFKPLWERQPWCREYSYWNNSDQPEELSAEQWAERERMWGLVFPAYDSPAETGYTFTLLQQSGGFMFASNADVQACLPTLNDRANARLMDYLVHCRKLAGQPEPTTYAEVMALKESPEAPAALAELTSLLVPELTVAMLRGHVPEVT